MSLAGESDEVKAKPVNSNSEPREHTPSQNKSVHKLTTSAANFDILAGAADRWPLDDSLPSLQEAGIPQLYPDDYSLVAEIKKLGRSLLLNFLELVTIMSSSPEEFPMKLEHIRIIMLNMHHLINQHRPHQTRESLIVLMEEQLARRTKGTEEIEAATAATRHVLERYRDFSVPTPIKLEQTTANGTSADSDSVTILQEVAAEDLRLFDMLQAIAT